MTMLESASATRLDSEAVERELAPGKSPRMRMEIIDGAEDAVLAGRRAERLAPRTHRHVECGEK